MCVLPIASSFAVNLPVDSTFRSPYELHVQEGKCVTHFQLNRKTETHMCGIELPQCVINMNCLVSYTKYVIYV